MKSMKLLSIGGYYPAGQTAETSREFTVSNSRIALSALRLQCALSPRTPVGKATLSIDGGC
jgi:hypothetical protein